MNATTIKFADGSTVRLLATNVIEEAIRRCDQRDSEAELLDAAGKVVGNVRRTPAAMNGFTVHKAA